jgi:hypothetical protein
MTAFQAMFTAILQGRCRAVPGEQPWPCRARGTSSQGGGALFISHRDADHHRCRRDFEALDPFAWYCWAAGTVALALLYFIA